jgi:hypothetical protein
VATCGGFTSSNTGAVATFGGTAGTTVFTLSPGAIATFRNSFAQITPGSDVFWTGGTWTIRVNVTTANSAITLIGVLVCQHNASSGALYTLASDTSQSVSASTTGVKTLTATQAFDASWSNGDLVYVTLVYSSSSSMTQTWAFTGNQNIDSPFVVINPAVYAKKDVHHAPTLLTFLAQ